MGGHRAQAGGGEQVCMISHEEEDKRPRNNPLSFSPPASSLPLAPPSSPIMAPPTSWPHIFLYKSQSRTSRIGFISIGTEFKMARAFWTAVPGPYLWAAWWVIHSCENTRPRPRTPAHREGGGMEELDLIPRLFLPSRMSGNVTNL